MNGNKNINKQKNIINRNYKFVLNKQTEQEKIKSKVRIFKKKSKYVSKEFLVNESDSSETEIGNNDYIPSKK